LRLLAGRMRPGAPLQIATDHAAYASWIEEHLTAAPHFDSRYDSPFVTEDPDRIRTKYEEKALAAGRVCHYFHWRRNETAVSPPIPIPQEYPMPHVVLRSPLSLAEAARRFHPFFVSEGEVGIKFIDLFQAQGGDYLLVETYVNETPLSQRVGLSIRARASGDWVVSLHEIGFPRPTAGMHRAVARLAAWVAGLHPDTEILTSSLQGTVSL
jgi:tRNA (guanine-N7-)-methyltransferase